ncbi:MAG: sensor histidine kinase [Candidatus Dadabacteria bacterium]
MQRYPFIFSNEAKYRIQRHLTFWIFWWLFQGFLYAFTPIVTPIPYWQRIPQSVFQSLLYLPTHIFLSYSLMYFVIPRYVVKQKYVMATILMTALIIMTGSLAALIGDYILSPVTAFFLPDKYLFIHSGKNKGSFYLSLLAGLRGGITIGGLAAAIKLMKHWYVEGQRNLQLQKENVESQLQVLKAQVHPHFLFNTLNNIYSYTQYTSPVASKMVMGLSDMLRYMLYECNQQLTPLAKELRMIEEYINLEKIRYGNKLELHLDFPGDTSTIYIAPLLLLPFVENCFKHGISNMLEHPWLNMSVTVENNEMTMKLLNSKPSEQQNIHSHGIGIQNVRRRLELLYPEKHQLTINNEEDVFIVMLKVELERNTTIIKASETRIVLTPEPSI